MDNILTRQAIDSGRLKLASVHPGTHSSLYSVQLTVLKVITIGYV